MIHTHDNRGFLLFSLLLGALAPATFGQVLPAGNLTAPVRSQIDAYVGAHVSGLAGADPTLWGAHRISLISTADNSTATPAFYADFAASLNTALIPLASNKDARIRLNVAIVAARAAAKAGNGALAPVTEVLLKDTNDGVLLWALQSSKYVVPALLASTNSKEAIAIGKLVLTAVQERDLSVTISEETARNIVDEAYRTILLEPTLAEKGAQPKNFIATISATEITAYVPTVQDFLAYRVKAYDDGLPKQVVDDTFASTFLTSGAVWHAQTPAQQSRSLGTMVGLLKGASKQYDAGPPTAQSGELLRVLQRTGEGFQVVGGGSPPNPALTAAGKSLAALPTGALSTSITADIAAVEAALPAPPAH